MGVHDGHRQRLRDRFLKYGLDALEDHEVLELALFYTIHRQDTNPLAHALIDHFGSLSAVMDASLSDLMQVKGIGEHTAFLIFMMKPLCRRYMISCGDNKRPLASIDECMEYLIPYFFGSKEEHVFLLCLDARCKPICCRELSEGSAVASELSVRKAAQVALDVRAASVVLAHNHPGGDLAPSPEDFAVTQQLKQTLSSMGIKLADHVIVSGNTACSMAKTGFFY